MTLSLKWANLASAQNTTTIGWTRGSGMSDLGLTAIGSPSALGFVSDSGHPVYYLFNNLATQNYQWQHSNANFTGYKVTGASQGTSAVSSFFVKPSEGGGFGGTMRGFIQSNGSAYDPSTNAIGVWLTKDGNQTSTWKFSVNPNQSNGTVYTTSVDISRLPALHRRTTSTLTYTDLFKRVNLAYLNCSTGSTSWKAQLWLDDVKVAEHTYASVGNVAWDSTWTPSDMVYVYQNYNTLGFQNVMYANDLLYSCAESDLPTARWILVNSGNTTATGWNSTIGGGSLTDSSEANGVRETTTSTVTATMTPATTASDTNAPVDYTKVGLFKEKPDSSHQPYMPYLWGGVLLARQAGNNNNRTFQIKDSAGSNIYTDSSISLSTGNGQFFQALPTGIAGAPIVNNASRKGGAFTVIHNGSGSDTDWYEGYFWGLALVLGPYRVSATADVSIAGATVTSGPTEHFTSLTVNATASAVVATPVKSATTSNTVDATGAVTIAGATRVTSGAAALAASSILTVTGEKATSGAASLVASSSLSVVGAHTGIGAVMAQGGGTLTASGFVNVKYPAGDEKIHLSPSSTQHYFVIDSNDAAKLNYVNIGITDLIAGASDDAAAMTTKVSAVVSGAVVTGPLDYEVRDSNFAYLITYPTPQAKPIITEGGGGAPVSLKVVSSPPMTVDGFATVSGAASLTASPSLVVAGNASKTGAADLSASPSLTVAGDHTGIGAAGLTASSSLVADGEHTGIGAASLAATSALTIVGAHTGIGAVFAQGGGTLTVTGEHTGIGAAALAATSTLVVAGEHTGIGAADLTASSSLVADGAVSSMITGAAALTRRSPSTVSNTAEGGTDGVAVTVGNSGGASGDAFDSTSDMVWTNAGYSGKGIYGWGSVTYEMFRVGGAATGGIPAIEASWLYKYPGISAYSYDYLIYNALGPEVHVDGFTETVQLKDAKYVATVAESSAPLVAGEWYRFELTIHYVAIDDPGGYMQLKIFDNPVGTTPLEILTAYTYVNEGTGFPTEIDFWGMEEETATTKATLDSISLSALPFFVYGFMSTAGVADLAASSSLAADGDIDSPSVSGAADLVASSSLVVAGVASAEGAADLAASASLAVVGAHTGVGAVFAQGGGTMVVAGEYTRIGVAALVASPSLSVDGDVSGSVTGAVALAATSSLVVAGEHTAVGAADLTASASLAVDGEHTGIGAADLVASSSLAVVGAHTGVGAVFAQGGGTMVVAGEHTGIGEAALVAVASLTAAGDHTGIGAADLTAISTLEATAADTTGAASLTAVSSLVAAGVLAVPGAADLAAVSSLTVLGAHTGVGAVMAQGGGTMTVDGVATIMGAADLVASSLMVVSSQTIGSASLTASSTMVVSGVRKTFAAAALVANPSLSATWHRLGKANLAASSSLVVAGVHTGIGAVGMVTLRAWMEVEGLAFSAIEGAAALSAYSRMWASHFPIVKMRFNVYNQGVLTDSDCRFRLLYPDGADGTSITIALSDTGSLYRVAAGTYEVRIPSPTGVMVDDAGPADVSGKKGGWHYRFESDAPAQAAEEGRFVVL